MPNTTLAAFSIAVSNTIPMATPAFSQNRFMDEARERAERLKENDSVRQAEHPETAQPPITPANPAPAEAKPLETVAAPEQTKAPASAQ
jgi:hypothetical protein